jgi:phytol kinase
MNKDIINTGILALSFLSLFGVAEVLYYKFNVKEILTRKLVHMGSGFITLLFPIMLGNQWPVLFLCATFTVILLASFKFNFLRSINGNYRKSYASVSYPVSVYICYLVYNYYLGKNYFHWYPYIYFYIPILTLAVCDPVAALAGKKFPYGRYTIGKNSKTMAGSLAFFVSSIIFTVAIFFCLAIPEFSLGKIFLESLVIATLATLAEAVSGKIDNFTIPLVAEIILILFG